MHSCEAIQLSIDYIENNLDKNLSTKCWQTWWDYPCFITNDYFAD